MDGWNGYETEENRQWSFAGSLFYSIICITTIGYGDQTPKTQAGKIVTIAYAVIGIPLMVLCLTNTGNAMATCFRFIYWRMCCFLCTVPASGSSGSYGGGSRPSGIGLPPHIRRRARARSNRSLPHPVSAITGILS